ncbi:phenylacetate--CoA ligase family protein [Salibacter halophilus]|uniref:Phenylacetate--CoA ligase family protein n=1 Tax=Salibacter halophilus TaxID=1803916 RepID=A0A6N6M743_9FLAO|nr:hypothetical protein [Salibacter halophilus]KAB1063549.1 hypothetical protein F3059_10810 [Salibacter halophilus]
MNFRKKVFWIVDLLNRGAIKKGVKKLNDAYDIDIRTFHLLYSEESLNALINYASSKVDYYPSNGKVLSDFKSISKLDIRNELNHFLSPDFVQSELIEQVTSGSTGVPFTTYWSRRKKQFNSIDTIFFNQLAGYDIGIKFYYFKIWNELNRKSFLKRNIENVVPVDVRDSSDSFWIRLIQNLSNAKRKVFLLGYASAIEELSKTCERQDVKLHSKILGIITMSEALPDSAKAHMRQWLSENVFARYSNMENGIIAQQVDESGRFLINSHSFKVETLKMDSDESVSKGEIGRIVITDIYNYAMPLIRYDTGDLGRISSCGMYLDHIEGRKMDAIYNTKDQLISSFVITNMMWKYKELLQYQFVQCSRTSYLFKLNIGNNTFTREKELIEEFKGYLGYDAEIKIEYVKEVPLLNSGKRRKVLNLMRNHR